MDFLTTLARGNAKPRRIEALSVTAQPLKFLDYLVQMPTQSVLLNRRGHCVVANPNQPPAGEHRGAFRSR